MIPSADDEATPAEIDHARRELEAAKIDGDKMLLDQGEGWQEILHYDGESDKFHVERVEDVESTLEWCKGRFNEGLANKHCEFRHVARYPANVVEIFGRKNGIPPGEITRMLCKDDKLTARLLNDRDLAGFRVLPGRI